MQPSTERKAGEALTGFHRRGVRAVFEGSSHYERSLRL